MFRTGKKRRFSFVRNAFDKTGNLDPVKKRMVGLKSVVFYVHRHGFVVY